MVTNIGGRWVPFFLPTLAVAFATTIPRLTVVIGVAEMAGLGVLLVGRRLDRGWERAGILASLVIVAGASLLATTGSLLAYAAAAVATMFSVALCTVSGHTYLSRRVRFNRRARAISTFEISWALSLLIGAPLAAYLIATVGWQGPFLFVAAAAVVVGVLVARGRDSSVVLDVDTGDGDGRFGLDAWLVIVGSGAIAVTGLSTVVVVGTWLDDALGVSTGGVGLVAMAFGAAELVASSSSAAIADRVGPNRATRAALVVTLAGLVLMTQAGTSLPVGVAALLLFFLGFEFAIVTSFAVVSEAVPGSRGRVLAANTAVGTVMRGAAISAAGALYATFGITGPALVSMVAAVVGTVLLTAARRRAGPSQPVSPVA